MNPLWVWTPGYPSAENPHARALPAGRGHLFSTHVLEVAQNLCDKVAIIKNGALVASGTMEEVRGSQSLEQVFLELEGQA